MTTTVTRAARRRPRPRRRASPPSRGGRSGMRSGGGRRRVHVEVHALELVPAPETLTREPVLVEGAGDDDGVDAGGEGLEREEVAVAADAAGGRDPGLVEVGAGGAQPRDGRPLERAGPRAG